MKHIYTLLFVIVLSIPFNIHAQLNTTDTNTLIIGTWTFDYTTSITHLAPDKKELFDAFTPDILTNIEKAYVNRTLTFDPSGTFIQTSQGGRTTTGTWKLSSDNRVIEMTNTAGMLLETRVVQLSEQNLLLSPIEPGESTLLMNQWYFTKL